MGSFRLYRRVNIFPGLSVNLSKSGPSLSVGVRGAHLTLGRKGIRKTVGIPGTGIYYTSYKGYHTGFHSAHQEAPLSPQEQAAADRKAERLLAVIGVGIMLLIAALLH